MFERSAPRSGLGSALYLAELIYHGTVREVRKSHRSPLIGLFMNILQMVIFVLAFYVMFSVLGLRGLALRGDFLLFLLSGIFLFMTHTKAVAAVLGSEGPASPMMQHAPMNTVIAISSAALGSLYIQLLAAAVILFFYHVLFTPVVIEQPAGAVAMFILAWFSGVAVGMVFLALKPWMPGFVSIASMVYMRANMIASGKMFVANALPPTMLAMFSWNPLFHAIDQARGFTFINYNPHNTSITYPLILSVVLIMIGLMGEFYTRRNASISWQAGR